MSDFESGAFNRALPTLRMVLEQLIHNADVYRAINSLPGRYVDGNASIQAAAISCVNRISKPAFGQKLAVFKSKGHDDLPS